MMLGRGGGRVPMLVLTALFACAAMVGMCVEGALAAQGEVTPDATPVITDFNPKEATVGEEVRLTIEGKNFAPGVYVSFSTPLVHAVATERVSATKLEVTVRVGKKAPPDVISLYVSNTGSVVAEVPFKIVVSSGAPTVPLEATPAAAAPAPAAAPAAPPPAAAKSAAPEIQKIEPAVVPRGGQVELKISGKNFASGAKVALANPGIRVLDTQVIKDTELVARIQIRPDAAPGETNLFVVNPDEEEAEAPFVVSGEVTKAKSAAVPVVPTVPAAPASAPAAAPAITAAPAAKAAAAQPSADALRFEVYGIADISAVLQARNKPKGTLTLDGGKLRFEEAGKEIFSVPATDIKEVEVNMLLGVNTGTFHVILSSGQSYNFVGTSLRPADTQAIVDALKRALKLR